MSRVMNQKRKIVMGEEIGESGKEKLVPDEVDEEKSEIGS